ncbi:glutamate mutase L [Candidatus Bathyarchaeota archaeon]|nr:glutamate mutase L [Candidatus Bathyarchaeota archaeon]
MSTSLDVDTILATDVGSTTSKAILIKKVMGEFRLVGRGEAPTTVESPFEDVRVGVRNAVKQVEDLTGIHFLTKDGALKDGIFYVSTSSAGGGLQIMVSGVIRRMTAESGERAALGAGAIVLDVIAIDDGRELHEKIERMRSLRPDMILMVGGTDGGDKIDLLDAAELFISAKPRPRFGLDFKLPIIFAGNKDVQNNIKDILGDTFALRLVSNIRPTLSIEDTEPAREGVHDFYLEHVMSHAPGYPNLMKWTNIDIVPTPAAVGDICQMVAEAQNINLVGTDPGGATTDIFSVFDGKFLRTVSANLGMSYSICNVLKEAGVANIMRWIPYKIEERDLRNRLMNKMIRPTTIPPDYESLMVEQAVGREAMRLAFRAHLALATPLRGVKKRKDLGSLGARGEDDPALKTYIDRLKLDMIIGSGGVNSHAPRRVQAACVLIDAFQPEGITQLMIDSIFMMPHLGVLSKVKPNAALNVLNQDCLVRVGSCIAPKGLAKDGTDSISVTAELPDGTTLDKTIPYGTMELIPLGERETIKMVITPRSGLDVGNGSGKRLETTVSGGVVGLIFDTRGRPLVLPENDEERRENLIKWYLSLGIYPEKILKRYM